MPSGEGVSMQSHTVRPHRMRSHAEGGPESDLLIPCRKKVRTGLHFSFCGFRWLARRSKILPNSISEAIFIGSLACVASCCDSLCLFRQSTPKSRDQGKIDKPNSESKEPPLQISNNYEKQHRVL